MAGVAGLFDVALSAARHGLRVGGRVNGHVGGSAGDGLSVHEGRDFAFIDGFAFGSEFREECLPEPASSHVDDDVDQLFHLGVAKFGKRQHGGAGHAEADDVRDIVACRDAAVAGDEPHLLQTQIARRWVKVTRGTAVAPSLGAVAGLAVRVVQPHARRDVIACIVLREGGIEQAGLSSAGRKRAH